MSNTVPPLFAVEVTEDRGVEVPIGPDFTPDHLPLMLAAFGAACAARSAAAEERHEPLA